MKGSGRALRLRTSPWDSQVHGMARSSHGYARNARPGGEGADRAAKRKAVVDAFDASGGTYGYRRIHAQVNASGDMRVGEWTVRLKSERGGADHGAPLLLP